MSPRVSIIGVGNMGGGMAHNLLAKGYRVFVHDLELQKVDFLKRKGALSFVEHAQVAIKSEVFIIAVVDAAQTRQVLFEPTAGIAFNCAKSSTVMLCPTIAPQDTTSIALELQALSVHCIDAPMSGGPVRATEGTMSLMLACAEVIFKQHEKLLNDLSSRLFFISEKVGDAARTKLVNNLLAAVNLAGAAECITLAQKLGLDAAKTLDVIEQSSAQSWIGSDRMRRAIAGDFAPRAHMGLLAKDTQLALQMANSAGFETPVGSNAAALFQQALQAGLTDLDDSALVKLF